MPEPPDSGLFRALQADCKTQLESQKFFSGDKDKGETAIPIITEDLLDIESRIAIAVGQLGACVILLTVTAEGNNPNVAGPQWEDIRLVARVKENVTINRAGGGTLQPASLVAEAVAHHLHHFTPSTTSNCIVVEKISLVPDDKHLTYDVLCKWRGGRTAAPQRITA